MLERKASRLTLFVGRPSKYTVPSVKIHLRSAKVSELFPLPVLPTTPTRSPGLSWKDRLWRISGLALEYRALRFSTRISPLVGHAAGGFPSFVGFGSCSISVYCTIRSMLDGRVSTQEKATERNCYLVASTWNILNVRTKYRIREQKSTALLRENPTFAALMSLKNVR